jgi:hypothetical protein
MTPCEGCKSDNLDEYACPDQQEYCLDCCGCHEE